MHNLDLRNGDLGSLSLRSKYLHKLFGILWQGVFIYLSHLFTYSIFFISIWTHGNLLYTLGVNPILTYFVIQIISALAIGSSSVGYFVPLTYLCQCRFFKNHFLALQDALSYLVYFLLQSQNHFSKEPWLIC